MSSFSRGCVLPCIALEINRNSSKFCRLPRGIAEELGHVSSRIACLRVTWLEELSDVPSLYFAWNGSICSGTGVDAALEIPGTAFEGEDGAWALEALRSFGRGSEDPVMVEVQLVERIEDATAIELLPTSYQDWDIVSARAMVVEELLLRQMSMVVLANTFTLQLDGTMEVSFQVSMLETASTRRSLEDGGEQDDGLPKQNLLALLNQHTFVSVVPLERPKDDREASEEELQRNYKAQIEALKAKCIEHIQNSSSTQPLSVLPSSLRSVDTSFHASVTVGEGAKDRDYKIRAEYQRKGEVVVAKDSVFDECLDLLSSSHSTEEASSVSGSEVGKEDDDASILQIQKSSAYSNLDTQDTYRMGKTPEGPKYLIGKEGSFSYNSQSMRICPSDWIFTLFTVALIVVPTALALVVVVPMNEKIPIWLMIIFEILICISVFFSLNMLFKCATTDPGVIPNVNVYNSGIPD